MGKCLPRGKLFLVNQLLLLSNLGEASPPGAAEENPWLPTLG